MSNELIALSPLDGRYAKQLKPLSEIFSEYGLIKNRLKVEIEWLKTLADNKKIDEIPSLSASAINELNLILENFNLEHAAKVKHIESQTNHDVKAVEYWLKQRLSKSEEMSVVSEFIHFACTSADINNLSHALMLKSALEQVLLPSLDLLIDKFAKMAKDFAAEPMLSRTHGQAATPTSVGKEMANFVYRLKRQRQQISNQVIFGKLNGAVGNYNAHILAYPNLDWEEIAQGFVCSLGLTFNPYTTQIEPHDYMAELYQNIARINTILIDACRDIWGYISLGYFKQQVKVGEVGSSTMPHKVNPINFENAEGNFGLANALLNHLAEKLPISRFQRDLSDSTVLRNMGVGFGYSLLGYNSCLKGLNNLEINQEALAADLNSRWELLAEPIQTVMRRYGIDNPYEQLKEITRGKSSISCETLAAFIKQLDIPDAEKNRLLALTPSNYLGKANELARREI